MLTFNSVDLLTRQYKYQNYMILCMPLCNIEWVRLHKDSEVCEGPDARMIIIIVMIIIRTIVITISITITFSVWANLRVLV